MARGISLNYVISGMKLRVDNRLNYLHPVQPYLVL